MPYLVDTKMKIRPKTPNQLIAQHEDTSPEVRRQIEDAVAGSDIGVVHIYTADSRSEA